MRKSILGIIIALIAVLAVVWVLTMRGGDDENDTNGAETTQQTPTPPPTEPSPTPTPPTDEGDTPASSEQVTIENMAFSPGNITVKKGTTVTWTNNDSVAHTVTSDSGNTLDSGLFGQGETFSFTFNETGTFAYHCEPHPQMTGTITVTE